MTSSTTVPVSTSEVLGRAMAEARAGELEAACARAEQALADGGAPGPLNAFLGMVRCRMGDLDGGSRHLRAAHEAQPADVTIACNLITAYLDQRRYAEALAIASPSLAQSDPSLRIARFRGFLALSVEDFATAVEAYEKLLEQAPGDFESLNNLGNARLSIGDVDGAIEALRAAASLNPDAAPTQLNLARALVQGGHWSDAESVLRRTSERFSDDVRSLQDLNSLLQRLGRPEEALTAIKEAVRREPNDAILLVSLGNQQGLALEMEDAERSFRRAIELDSASTGAFFGLAVVYEHTNRKETLKALAAEGEAAGLASEYQQLIRAMALRRSKDFEEGLKALEQIGADVEPIRCAQLQGQFLDALGRTDEAFAAFARMNALHAEQPSDPLKRAADYRGQLRTQRATLTEAWLADWSADEGSSHPPVAFLVGFPRSGTTLLDTMLMGHADVAVLEERPIIHLIERDFGGFDALPVLTPEQLQQERDRYFREVAKNVEVRPGQLLIDKNPLHLNRVPTIRRLFPNAKFILALRHPCDALLSCFMANFRPNTGMSNFLRLEDAAEFYDLTFGYWEQATQLLAPPIHSIAYEQVTADPEGQLRPLVEFLDLEWQDSILDHQRTASERGLIRTASYAQVQEPLHRQAVGRWERYRKHLQPVLPTLEPWIEKFGYGL